MHLHTTTAARAEFTPPLSPASQQETPSCCWWDPRLSDADLGMTRFHFSFFTPSALALALALASTGPCQTQGPRTCPVTWDGAGAVGKDSAVSRFPQQLHRLRSAEELRPMRRAAAAAVSRANAGLLVSQMQKRSIAVKVRPCGSPLITAILL